MYLPVNVFQTVGACALAWVLVGSLVWLGCRAPDAQEYPIRSMPPTLEERLKATELPRLHNSVTINACYKIRNGQLRLAAVSSSGTLFCRRNELPIQWPAQCCGASQ